MTKIHESDNLDIEKPLVSCTYNSKYMRCDMIFNELVCKPLPTLAIFYNILQPDEYKDIEMKFIKVD